MSNKFQPKKVNWWHERLIDWMLANPHRNIKDAAREFDVTPQYLYMLKNSDLFLDAWRQRSMQHSAIVTGTIKDKAFAVAEMALDNLATKVAEQVEHGVMSIRDSLEIVDVTMRRFGYGEGRSQPGVSTPQVTINLGLLSPDQIASARAKLRGETLELEASPSIEGRAASSDVEAV